MNKGAKLLSVFTLIFLMLILGSAQFIRPFDGKFASPFPLKFDSSLTLQQHINIAAKDSETKFGVYVKKLNSEEAYKLNETQEFEAASLYKLWVMGTIYGKINNGSLKETDRVSGEIKDLNRKFNISEDEAELKEGFLQYSITSAIEQMITISHNYAAFLLLTKTSNSEINSFIKALGLKNSTMSLPIITTPEDIALFYEKLYKGEIVSEEYSKEMMEVLKKQEINDRLPKYLPEGVVIAHKTGNLGYFENDAGIVFTPNGDYIIVVLTQSKKPLESREKIAQFSKVVYEHFSK